MSNVLDIIKRRYSVRTYGNGRVEEDKVRKIKEYIASNRKGPFGNEVRFEFVDASEDDIDELKKLGTYGNTSGARLYIAGVVKNGERAMEDFGYCMEKNILFATELGLGTIWLGGSLNRSSFADRIGISENEVIPAVTPVGYPGDKRSAMDRIIAFMVKSRKRKEFKELFFNGDLSIPLQEKECGAYSQVLEAVRIAPSASNKQPWRIIKEKDKNIFHIYFNENVVYNNSIKGIKIQNIDMGIAMAHFELATGELGLKGSWTVKKQELSVPDMYYIASWEGEK